MKKIFITILFIIFLVITSRLIYKKFIIPDDTSKISTSSSPHSNNIKITQGVNQLQTNEESFNKKLNNYILTHPEVLIESIENFQRNKIEESNKHVGNYLLKNKSSIENEGKPPILGNHDGDINIVVFYDYHCSFSKKANKIINKILAQDKGIKVILRPLPILGDISMYATKISLAVHKISEENFSLIHNKMMKMMPITEEGVKNLLSIHKIDYKIVENEINSFAMKQLIAKNFDLAKNLGVKGAPSYVLNGIFIAGLVDKERFITIIQDIRNNPNQIKNTER